MVCKNSNCGQLNSSNNNNDNNKWSPKKCNKSFIDTNKIENLNMTLFSLHTDKTIWCLWETLIFKITVNLLLSVVPYIAPHPSPTLSGSWQWYIRQTQRRACYCFLCLSEYGELPQRNTLCCFSWPSPVSVINHKTMKAIKRSLPSHPPFPIPVC